MKYFAPRTTYQGFKDKRKPNEKWALRKNAQRAPAPPVYGKSLLSTVYRATTLAAIRSAAWGFEYTTLFVVLGQSAEALRAALTHYDIFTVV